MKDAKKIGIWLLALCTGLIIFIPLHLFQSVYSTFENLPTRLRKKREIKKDLEEMPWRAHVAIITIAVIILIVVGMPWWGLIIAPLAVAFAYLWTPELDYSLEQVQEIIGELNENNSPEIEWDKYPLAKKISSRRRY